MAFATPGIVLALLFITVPVRRARGRAGADGAGPGRGGGRATLGASTFTVLRRVLLPPLAPAIISGTIRSYARALGEFGSIVVVSGNIPYKTLTAPIYVFGEIESGRAEVAAAVSVVLLAVALALTFGARAIERLAGVARA
ncbi:MAG: hypothetical protein MZW92_01745 [Comamonadaceae bacterium]|nr:hypothetical protein [Comamonadaceae bacterium]